MKSKSLKRISFLTTLCVSLSLVGYEFAVSLFSPILSGPAGTQIITIPYRGFVLILALYVLWLTRHFKVKVKFGIVCLFIYWCILIIRLISDIYLRDEFQFNNGEIQKIFLYVFGIDIPLLLVAIRGFRVINFALLYKQCFWMLFSSSIFIILFNQDVVMANPSELTNGRLSLAAINPITLGHMGAGLVILALYYSQIKYKILATIIKWTAIILGLFLVSKAASRGPLAIMCLLVCIYLYYKSKKYAIIAISIALLFIASWPLINDSMMEIFRQLSPSLYSRVCSTLQHGDPGRVKILDDVIGLIAKNPIIGTQFGYYEGGRFFYAHNILFDAMICGGILGLIIFLIPLIQSIVFSITLANTRIQFFILFALKFILTNFMSGSFYFSNALGELMAMIILLYGWQRYGINSPIIMTNLLEHKNSTMKYKHI